jgi:ABC-2 type transport system permease protein
MLLLRYELYKTFRKWRSYISFLAVAAVVPLVILAVHLQGQGLLRNATRGLGADFLILGNILNGYFVTQFLMNALWVHVPFLITLGAGDQLAGEATGGTFRLLLTRPASRTAVLMAKYCTTLLYTVALVLFLGVLSVGLGVAVFGTGPLLIPGRAMVIIPESEALVRVALALGLATWGMITVASLAFLFSSLVENGIGPLVGTMAVVIVFYIVAAIPVDLFAAVRPYLFTTYMSVWQQAFAAVVPWSEVLRSVAILGAFSVGFLCTTWYIFLRRDILS